MKKIKEKIDNLSTKQILFISLPISITAFLVMKIICTKMLDLFSGIVIGLILGVGVQLLIAECICNYSYKECQEKIKKNLETKLRYTEYDEVYLRIFNEYQEISVGDSIVRYYAKLHENDVEVMIYAEHEAMYKYLSFIEFNRIFSTMKPNIF